MRFLKESLYDHPRLRLRLHERPDAGTQKALFKAAGVERIFSENVSGVTARRPALDRVLDELAAGDVLVVTKLDRLARSTLDLLRIIDQVGKEGAGFRSLGDPWADTTSPHGRLMLTVLGGIADYAELDSPAHQ